VLGAAGIVSAVWSTVGAFTGATWMIGVGSAIMLCANIYALARR
jgi:hypothetical protein